MPFPLFTIISVERCTQTEQKFSKHFFHFFYTTMTLTFIYYKLIKIHCCKSNHTKDTIHSETVLIFVPIFNYILNIYQQAF